MSRIASALFCLMAFGLVGGNPVWTGARRPPVLPPSHVSPGQEYRTAGTLSLTGTGSDLALEEDWPSACWSGAGDGRRCLAGDILVSGDWSGRVGTIPVAQTAYAGVPGRARRRSASYKSPPFAYVGEQETDGAPFFMSGRSDVVRGRF